jgi:endonuclease YncB( thermonuclease family)
MGIYTYSDVTLVKVHDGDTMRFRLASEPIDIGFGMFVSGSTSEFSCRVLGYACREIGEPGGAEARQHVTNLLLAARSLLVVSVRWDKYGGRYDGHVILNSHTILAEEMIKAGYGAPWDGKGAQPKPPWPIP